MRRASLFRPAIRPHLGFRDDECLVHSRDDVSGPAPAPAPGCCGRLFLRCGAAAGAVEEGDPVWFKPGGGGNGRGSRIHASTFWQQGEVLENETLTDQERATGSVGDKDSVCSHPGDEGDVAPQGCCPPAGSLRELDNEKAQRLQLLEVRNTGISEVHKWISQNRDQFRGQVGAAVPGRETSTLPRASLPPPLGMRTTFECLQRNLFLATIAATYAAI